MSLVGKNNEEKIWYFLKNKGLNNYGIASMMGNLFAESGLNPNNLENTGNSRLDMTDEEYVIAVNNGAYARDKFINDRWGFGIAQWTLPDRKRDFYDFVKSKNKSIDDLETQLEYLYKELSRDFSSVLTTLKTATSILQASNIVLFKFENPKDQSVDVQNKRASYGQGYYDKYANTIIKDDTTVKTKNEQELREKIVSTAVSYLGCRESDGSHRKIIDIYNSVSPLPVGYRLSYTDSWCAGFVTAVGIKAGLSDIIYRECSCPRMIELYKKNNRWIENDAYVPSKGDIIFYDWEDSGSGNNMGTSDHVGIVVSVSGNTIKVIEGNMSDAVGYRNIQVNGRYIRGYGIPNYGNTNINANTTSSSTVSSNVSTPTLSVSTTTISGRIDTVREVQIWANTNYKAGLVVDDKYGEKTKEALVKILQTELNRTYGSKLIVDGKWGNKTKAACKTLKYGSKNNVVGVLQALLICNGYTNAYLDNDYGSATTSAVKSYQNKNELTVDGKAGKNTFAKLCS